MGQPVAVLQQQVDSQEFTEWIVFNSIEPIGEYREDIRCAMLAQVLASLFRKSTPPLKQFIYDYWRTKKSAQSPDEMLTVFKASVRRK